MAAQLRIPVVALTADGAASELSAQSLMDHEKSELPALEYHYPLYGVHLQAPVFIGTGPMISITDPPHSRKTCRNQPQYGTHTASLGIGFLVNQSFIDLYETPGSGLVLRDVENVDKQDDGAARRIFHTQALTAATSQENGVYTIRPNFEGLFCYLFIMGAFDMTAWLLTDIIVTGTLFEAWMSPSMKVEDRVLAALRARFWLHFCQSHILKLTKQFPDLYSPARSFISPASFHIFNRLCDTLVLLALAFARYYPEEAFCPEKFNTEFLEHFFGIGRQLLPNFSYAEFLKMVQHIMARQRILESGLLKSKRERTSASGYIFNPDTDLHRAVHDDSPLPTSSLTDAQLNRLVELAYNEAAHVCRDILFIPVSLTPTRPLQLQALGSAKQRRKVSAAHRKGGDSDEDADEDEDEDEMEDGDDDSAESDIENEDNPSNIGEATAIAARDAARYAALCTDVEGGIEAGSLRETDINLPSPHPLPPLTIVSQTELPVDDIKTSQLLHHSSGKASVKDILDSRRAWQSGTTTKSERVVIVNPKFSTLKQVLDSEKEPEEDTKKLSIKEAAHRLRIAQELNGELKRQEQKKVRQIRWQQVATQIQKELKLGEKGLNILFDDYFLLISLFQICHILKREMLQHSMNSSEIHSSSCELISVIILVR